MNIRAFAAVVAIMVVGVICFMPKNNSPIGQDADKDETETKNKADHRLKVSVEDSKLNNSKTNQPFVECKISNQSIHIGLPIGSLGS